MDIYIYNRHIIYVRSALYKLIDKIVWYIPFKRIRNKIRKKIIEDIDNIFKYD